MATENILTVSEVTRHIKGLLEDDYLLQDVWLRGELSNFKHHSRGHMYFTVKDQNSRLQSVMFAGNNRFLRFKPEDGMKVLIRGEINVYEPYGQYQLYVKEMQPDGVGSLYLAYERLKASLEQEGLFADARKKAIPRFPRRVAIITSPTGAAIRDMMTTIKRRCPIVHVTLLPVLVQGDEAPLSIKQAIEQANLTNWFDVIIVGRGGGSIEELWAFNDEQVARAIAQSSVPIISAVGHETDFTISDFVADLRAPTPTGAAELAVPDLDTLQQQVSSLRKRLVRTVKGQVDDHKRQLNRYQRSYAFRYPEQLVQQKEQQLDGYIDQLKKSASRLISEQRRSYFDLDKGLQRNHPKLQVKQAGERVQNLHQELQRRMHEQLQAKKTPFQRLIGELNLLSPLRIMERGYSLAYEEGSNNIIKSTEQVEVGSNITLRVHNGELACQVKQKRTLHEQ
ncbi:exodeoxyribonuclease VII large subunit [Halalkalibacter urbisdiaboli]|uniref:exodeoxyribonuclease VII large subunit n=1 Tax=Halalkalibacter urbisdiaboli TaxID=1960589 RepID=UPI000B445B13|nr:exodeoxyribonuclease VII large subunit [Halalkalibacter urbisdiaboli]